MKQKFIEWFIKSNNGCSPAMEDDRSFVHEKAQHMFEAYQAGVAEGEAKCSALAAEKAGLKNQLRELFNSCDTGERRGNGSLSGAAVPDWCVLEKTRQFLESAPTTDAFLAEVRAQGVEMFAAYCGEENSVFVEAKAYYRSLPDAAYEFAANLRKGVQS